MTRVTSRSEPLFQSVWVRLRFASTQIIRFSSGSLFAILKNRPTVRVRLRFDKNSVKPVYKTPVRVRFDSLIKSLFDFMSINLTKMFRETALAKNSDFFLPSEQNSTSFYLRTAFPKTDMSKWYNITLRRFGNVHIGNSEGSKAYLGRCHLKYRRSGINGTKTLND